MSEDRRLLERAKRFDPDGLGALHLRFYEPVYRYVSFKVGDHHTSEDLTSEVFVRVLEALKHGRGWHTSPNAWIFGIARNVVADYYRRGRHRTELVLDEDLSALGEDDPAHTVVCIEQRKELMVAISSLTDEQRDVILLRFVEGLSIRHVAQVLHKTNGAVKSLQYRAMCALSNALQHRSDETGVTKLYDR